MANEEQVEAVAEVADTAILDQSESSQEAVEAREDAVLDELDPIEATDEPVSMREPT